MTGYVATVTIDDDMTANAADEFDLVRYATQMLRRYVLRRADGRKFAEQRLRRQRFEYVHTWDQFGDYLTPLPLYGVDDTAGDGWLLSLDVRWRE